MIARLTRWLLLAQAAIAMLLAALFHALGMAWGASLAWGCFLVLALRMLIAANNYLLASYFRAPIPPERRIGLLRGVAMYLREFTATAISSSWGMPFCAFRRRAVTLRAGLPVLLVHGYACNSGYWTPMSRPLQSAGIAHDALDLEPIGGGVDEYAAPLHEAIEDCCRAHGSEKVVILAHSMGGLATRAYLRRYGMDRIAGVVTLGSPHHGSGLAIFGPGKNSKQMRWFGRHGVGRQDQWLQALEDSESAELRRLFVSIWSHHDNIVSPPTSSIYADAKNIEVHGIGHVALGRHPHIMALAIEEVLLISAAAARG